MKKIEGKTLVYLDLSSRWSITYFMLDSTLKFQKVFEHMKEEDMDYHSYFHDCDDEEGNFVPSSDDGSNVQTFIKFLKVFYDASLKLSASLHITSHQTFIFMNCLIFMLNWSTGQNQMILC